MEWNFEPGGSLDPPGSGRSAGSPRPGCCRLAEEADEPSLLAFYTASLAVGLRDLFRGPGPVTVFAPRDEAFEELPKSMVAELLRPRHRDALLRLLAHHVVEGELRLDASSGPGLLFPEESAPIPIWHSDAGLHVGDARVLSGPHEASNGLLYVVDRLLLPR
jgi:uncharacterized surface protein with fasciclin (FAS1) repeats